MTRQTRSKTTLPLVSLRACGVQFDNQPSGQWGLAPIDFTLHAGERWVITGANGAGKSVLLKLIRGDMWPTPTGNEQREYGFDGTRHREPAGLKHHIGFVAPERQDKYVRYGWNLSVTQVVTTGLFDEDIPLTKPDAAQRARVARVMRQFRLWSLRERKLLELSYGQRRRVLLARLFVAKPTLWLLDEVFNGLDTTTRQHLLAVLADPKQASTWMLVAHSAEDIPPNATHALHLQRGRVKYMGPVGRMDHGQRTVHHSIASDIERESNARHAAAERLIKQRVIPTPKALGKPDQPLISLHNVQLFRQYRPVVREVNWTIQSNEHWAIMGDNGSGKSTLLLLLYGDLHPMHGGLIERAGCPKGTPIAKWKQHVGYVSPELQADHVWTHTVEELVASGRYASVGLNQPITAADRRAATPWLEFVGLNELRTRTLRQVSYGQARLALLARALILRPRLLLLDEPFTGLDPDHHAFMRAALQKLANAGTQLVMAIHDRADAPPAINRLLMIGKDGRVSATRY